MRKRREKVIPRGIRKIGVSKDFIKKTIKETTINTIQESDLKNSGIKEWLEDIYQKIKKYNEMYERAEKDLFKSSGLDPEKYLNKRGEYTIRDQKDGNYNDAIKALRQARSNLSSRKFLSVLEHGDAMLHQIRNQLTNQEISTKLTVLIQGKLMIVDPKSVKAKTVLSTYGSSGQNLYSLAYEVDLKALKNELARQEKNKSLFNQEIYDYFMKIKVPYLSWGKREGWIKNLKAKPKFDYADAEILDYLSQKAKNSKEELTLKYVEKEMSLEIYRDYRTIFGRNRKTTSLQLGDVSLIQDKFISADTGQREVNFSRMTQVKKTLQDLEKLLKKYISNNSGKEALQEYLIKTFTGKDQNLDKISEATSKEAEDYLNNLFKNF